jgi:hypothetical protein
VKEHWRNIVKTFNRTVIPHGVKHYEELQEENYAWLLNDQQRGKAVPADRAGRLGKGLQEMLEELLNHPLCRRLTQKPVLFVHKDLGSRVGTFGNVILVPFYEWPADGDLLGLRGLRAALAHELGHIICRDSEPTEQAHHPHRYMNQRMERRADLIASHLCGDGGKALAERFAAKLKDEKMYQPYVNRNMSWLDRVTNGIVGCMDRRYPSLETRIRYLRNWADGFEKGQPLPDIDTPDLSLRHRASVGSKHSMDLPG